MNTEGKPGRGSWYLLTGLLIGLTLGLLIAWVIAPVTYVDTAPVSLRSDFKDLYRSLIASAYLATGDLGRAQSRLSLLGDVDSVHVLSLQAQNTYASGDINGTANALSKLADALKQLPQVILTPSSLPPLMESSTLPVLAASGVVTLTPNNRVTFSPTLMVTPTPRPTRTPTATIGAAFALISQENVCDGNLVVGLIQIDVRDASSQPLPGIEIVITWQTGEEHIFTGLKPELGDGYADFVMNPNMEYSIQLASGSQVINNLHIPTCQTDGSEGYPGGIRLVFQQP